MEGAVEDRARIAEMFAVTHTSLSAIGAGAVGEGLLAQAERDPSKAGFKGQRAATSAARTCNDKDERQQRLHWNEMARKDESPRLFVFDFFDVGPRGQLS